jgi:hypothetical protein
LPYPIKPKSSLAKQKFIYYNLQTKKIREQNFKKIDLTILTISTATTERSFLAMNIVKTRLRNKIDDEFLTNFLIVYIKREVATTISIDSIIYDFRDSQNDELHFDRCFGLNLMYYEILILYMFFFVYFVYYFFLSKLN